MPEEHNPEQDEGTEEPFSPSDQAEDGQEEDDDEVEAHSMGRLSLPEDPNTRF